MADKECAQTKFELQMNELCATLEKYKVTIQYIFNISLLKLSSKRILLLTLITYKVARNGDSYHLQCHYIWQVIDGEQW